MMANKTKITAIRLIIFLFLSVAITTARAAQKKALLVGIGNYPQGSGWTNISSAKDVDMLEGILSSTFSVIKIQDEEATLDRIIQSLDQLKSDTHPGDTILIHFSCHGQQMLTNDSSEQDSLDEALIPYDALSKKTEDYHGEKHLVDDVFGQKMEDIRFALHGEGLILVSLDACHSGHANKGSGNCDVYRGTNDIFGLDYCDSDKCDEIERVRFKKSNTSINTIGAAIVYISACSSAQRNYEYITEDGEHVGSLSLALAESYKECGIADLERLLNVTCSKIKKYSCERQDPEVIASFPYEIQEPQQQISKAPISEESGDSVLSFNVLRNVILLGSCILIVALLFVIYGRRK